MAGSPPWSFNWTNFKTVAISTAWTIGTAALAAAATAGLDAATELVNGLSADSVAFVVLAALIHGARKTLTEWMSDQRPAA